MSAIDRISNGWRISISCMKVLRANKQLIVFPILSGISLLLILGSFGFLAFAGSGWNVNNIEINNRGIYYLGLFLFYLLNYFIVVFFNMALTHCARLYFEGQEVSVSDGIQFSFSRIGVIFSWALFVATVGVLLRLMQDNLGWIGKIITGLIGIVWSITTFFVVPILAYEELGPIDAVKRSGSMIKEKWGEGLGAGFSFGLVNFAGVILIAVVAFAIGALVNVYLGIVLGVLGLLCLMAIMSALQSIFITIVYNDVNGKLNIPFDKKIFDDLFVQKNNNWS